MVGLLLVMRLTEVVGSGAVVVVFSHSIGTMLAVISIPSMRVEWRCVELDFYIDRITKIDEVIKNFEFSHDIKMKVCKEI